MNSRQHFGFLKRTHSRDETDHSTVFHRWSHHSERKASTIATGGKKRSNSADCTSLRSVACDVDSKSSRWLDACILHSSPCMAIESRKDTLLSNEKRYGDSNDSLSSFACESGSPQAHLDTIWRKRGYSTARVPTLESADCYLASDFQKASFGGPYLLRLLEHGQLDKLALTLASGISRNPVDYDGESLMHLVCRHGEAEALKFCFWYNHKNESDESRQRLLRCIDQDGQTLLHAACNATSPSKSFEIVRQLCSFTKECGGSMLWSCTDSSGDTPLANIPEEDWSDWISFLDSVKDEYWPINRSGIVISAPYRPGKPSALPCPENSLPMAIARKVSDGSLSTEEAQRLVHRFSNDEDNEFVGDDDSFLIDELSLGDSLTNEQASMAAATVFGSMSYGSKETFDTREMASVLATTLHPQAKPARW